MKIYTKTGDNGETSLFGGQRVPKSHARIDAYGTVDELNSLIGIVRTAEPASEIEVILERLQNELFLLGSDLATPGDINNRIDRVSGIHIRQLESDIDRLVDFLEPLTAFILPGGSRGAAHLHFARTVCRRAERICISCRNSESISDEAIIYLNRLSDLLFVMARFQNRSQEIADIPWKPRKKDK